MVAIQTSALLFYLPVLLVIKFVYLTYTMHPLPRLNDRPPSSRIQPPQRRPPPSRWIPQRRAQQRLKLPRAQLVP